MDHQVFASSVVVVAAVLAVFYPYMRRGKPRVLALVLGVLALLLSLVVGLPLQNTTRTLLEETTIWQAIAIGIIAASTQESLKYVVVYKNTEQAEWIGYMFGLTSSLLVMLVIATKSYALSYYSQTYLLLLGYKSFAITLFHTITATYMAIMIRVGYALRGLFTTLLVHALLDSYDTYLYITNNIMSASKILILCIAIGLALIILHKSIIDIEAWEKTASQLQEAGSET